MEVHLSNYHRLRQPLPKQIVVVRSLPGLGDFLCCIPAMRALRAAFPEAQVTLIGLPWARSMVQRFCHYFDCFLEFPGYPGIPEVALDSQAIVTFLAQVQRLKFDLALQLHGSGLSINSFVMLLGAKQAAGCFPKGHYCPDLNSFLPYPEHESEVWRSLRLMEFLGIPLQGEALEFPITQGDWQEWQAIATAYGLSPASYVCIHPGASASNRRWAPEQFAIVADGLAARGWQVVLTGTTAEKALTQEVAEAMHLPAIDLAGQTTLGAIAALLSHARLLICNDTGVSHLAAALRVKSVVIFSNSDPHRWAPLDQHRHRVVVDTALFHHPEQWTQRGAVQRALVPKFWLSATPDVVLERAIELLHQEVHYAL